MIPTHPVYILSWSSLKTNMIPIKIYSSCKEGTYKERFWVSISMLIPNVFPPYLFLVKLYSSFRLSLSSSILISSKGLIPIKLAIPFYCSCGNKYIHAKALFYIRTQFKNSEINVQDIGSAALLLTDPCFFYLVTSFLYYL